MKKIILPILCLCLFACETGTTSVNDTYASELSDDLKTLLISSPSGDRGNLPFDVEATRETSASKEGYYVTSCLFKYKEEILEDVHFMMVPYSYDLSKNLTDVASLGYDEYNYILDSTTIPSENRFKGYRISYLSDNKDDGVKVLFKSSSYDVTLFSFSTSEITSIN